jgi:hypothetical protein
MLTGSFLPRTCTPEIFCASGCILSQAGKYACLRVAGHGLQAIHQIQRIANDNIFDAFFSANITCWHPAR